MIVGRRKRGRLGGGGGEVGKTGHLMLTELFCFSVQMPHRGAFVGWTKETFV